MICRLLPSPAGLCSSDSTLSRERQRSSSVGMIARTDDLFRMAVPLRPGWNVMERRRRRCSFLGPQDELTLFAAGEEAFLDHVADYWESSTRQIARCCCCHHYSLECYARANERLHDLRPFPITGDASPGRTKSLHCQFRTELPSIHHLSFLGLICRTGLTHLMPCGTRVGSV
jgi:hypothetical protein